MRHRPDGFCSCLHVPVYMAKETFYGPHSGELCLYQNKTLLCSTLWKIQTQFGQGSASPSGPIYSANHLDVRVWRLKTAWMYPVNAKHFLRWRFGKQANRYLGVHQYPWCVSQIGHCRGKGDCLSRRQLKPREVPVGQHYRGGPDWRVEGAERPSGLEGRWAGADDRGTGGGNGSKGTPLPSLCRMSQYSFKSSRRVVTVPIPGIRRRADVWQMPGTATPGMRIGVGEKPAAEEARATNTERAITTISCPRLSKDSGLDMGARGT
jgi:hypothetical protein